MSPLAHVIATGFGAGRLPVAPGTWGSLIGLPIAAAVALPLSGGAAVIAVGIGGGLLFVVSLWATQTYLVETGHMHADPPEVVVDEILGQFLTTAPLLLVFAPISTLILSFVWFRVFDIAKPWPIGRVERIGGAHGVLLDDVVAAIPAAALTAASLAFLE